MTITAQKPHSTGSGFYLTEMVKGFAALGHEQAVLAGVYREDTVDFPAGTVFYPVHFKTEELPFPIAGMSDEMPYESTIYGQIQSFFCIFNSKGGRGVPTGSGDLSSSVSGDIHCQRGAAGMPGMWILP